MIYEGEVIGGSYQVIKQIGKGGSGLVFLAYHQNLRKYVVIKRVQRKIANLNALRAETDILKNLRHTNIPQVYDFLVRDGEVFTVMDYIDGTSFDKLPAGGHRIPEKNIVYMFLQLSEVLAYIHRKRPPVIHSDIKPDNLMLSRDGNVCLIDFNISISSDVSESLSGLSPHYASPEQYRRANQVRSGAGHVTELDARTDIYSAGAVFYYLITGMYPDERIPLYAGKGRNPAPAGTEDRRNLPFRAGLLYQDMISCGYSDALCRVIAKCLEPNRGMRYMNGGKLRSAILHLRRQDSRFRKYILLRAASWLLSAALLGCGSWFIIRGTRQQTLDSYIGAYQRLSMAMVTGEEETASRLGTELLNESRFTRIRSSRPQDVALILQYLGDCAYVRKQYTDAQEYYGEALETAKQGGFSTSSYYRDYAISLMMDQQLRRAQLILDEAKAARGITEESSLLSDPDLALVQAYIYEQEEEPGKCLEIVNAILESSADQEVKARACVLAADTSEKQDSADDKEKVQRLDWLLQATRYSGEPKYQRLLAAEYMGRCDDTGLTDEQRKKNAEQALSCYEKLCSRPMAHVDDQISQVIVMQYLGKYDESLRVLQPLLLSHPEDYQIPMYMAFAYDAKSERGSASRYAKEALGLYEASPDRNSADNEAIEYLKQLQ